MSTSAILGQVLTDEATQAYYLQQQIYWSNKYEANAAKLKDQQSAETKWESSYDAVYYADGDKDFKIGNTTYYSKESGKWLNGNRDNAALEYANKKVSNYNEELSIELADLDLEYDTMKTMYEAQLEMINARLEYEKQQLTQEAQDTHVLSS